MKYLVDSDWVIDYLAGRQHAITLLSSLAKEGLAVSLMTFGEFTKAFTMEETLRKVKRGFVISYEV